MHICTYAQLHSCAYSHAQVLGVDVLLDAKARPFLLEINDHPSFRIDLSYDEPGQYSMNGLNSIPSPVDEAIKVPMLTSALRLVAMQHSLRLGRWRRAKPRNACRGTHPDPPARETAVAADGGAASVAAEGGAAALAADDLVGGAYAEDPDETEADEEGETRGADSRDAEGEGRVEARDGESAPLPSPTTTAQPHPTGGVHGTAFYPVPTEVGDGFELLTRLAHLFQRHTPASVRRDALDPTRANHAPPPELAVPGPRWKGAAPFGAFLQSAGILARGGGAQQAKGSGRLPRPDLDLIFLAVCGKGGSMDVMDFAEACIRVAQRLWPDRADAHPSELLVALLDTYFSDPAFATDQVCRSTESS